MVGELTPRNFFPYPSENQEPYFNTFKGGELARDAAHWAHAENDLITIRDGGTFSWDALSGDLTWSTDINISTFTTLFNVVIEAATVSLQDGEVLFYQIPRLLESDTIVTLTKGSRINISGVRLHDLRLLAVREGDTIFMPEGKSLLTGESSILFGGGVSAGTVSTATSAPGGGSQGVVTADEDKGLEIASGILEAKVDGSSIQFNGSGELEAVGGGIVSTTVSGSGDTGTLGITRGNEDEGLESNVSGTMRVKYDGTSIQTNGSGELEVIAGGPLGSHQHLAPLVIEPGSAGISLLDAAITMTSSPSYISLQLFRNGQLMAQGISFDYTFNSTTGFITLALPTQSTTERFIIERIASVI